MTRAEVDMSSSDADEATLEERIEADAAFVASAVLAGLADPTFEAPDAEYAERVWNRAEQMVRGV